MAVLSSKSRKALPKSDFAVPSKAPGSGSYPIPDAAHARNAMSRVSANGSPAEKAEVAAKVHSRFPDIGSQKKAMANERKETPAAEKAESPATERQEKLSGIEVAIHKAHTLAPTRGQH